MKALNLSKLMFVFALALGAMAFYIAAAPSAANAGLFSGGWVVGEGCCEDLELEACTNNPYMDDEGVYCSEDEDTLTCIPTNDPTKQCWPQPYDYCDSPGVNSCPGSEASCI